MGALLCVRAGACSSGGLAFPAALFALSRLRWEAAFLVCAPIAGHGVVFSPPQGCVRREKPSFSCLSMACGPLGVAWRKRRLHRTHGLRGHRWGLARSQVSDLMRITSPGLYSDGCEGPAGYPATTSWPPPARCSTRMCQPQCEVLRPPALPTRGLGLPGSRSLFGLSHCSGSLNSGKHRA